MYHLTVGQISTLIAAAVFVCGLFLRNALPLIMVGLMRKESNAVTWGLLQRSLSSTDWPIVLQTDSTSCGTVDLRLRILNILYVATTIILAIAAVATPAGLYDDISFDGESTMQPFGLVKDPSAFGLIPRPNNPLAWRSCYAPWPRNRSITIEVNCPGWNQSFEIISNSSGLYQDWSGDAHFVSVPRSRPEIYHSGLASLGTTVSSFFDIQSRVVKLQTSDIESTYDDPMPIEGFQHLANTVREDRYLAIDGLVVDAKDGSIGFRNHTLPPNTALGTEWTEDLLFIEPETACVDMNLTIEFNIEFLNENSSLDGLQYALVDHGGFANLDVSLKPSFSPLSQDQLDLRSRAESYAWWALYATMNSSSMNLSDPLTGIPKPSLSYVGNRIPATEGYSEMTTSTGIQTSSLFLNFLTDFQTVDYVGDAYGPIGEVKTRCQGFDDSKIDIDNFAVSCGFIVGAAVQSDGRLQTLPEPGTKLVRKIYSCASAAKTSLKTVHFNYNDTTVSDLSRLDIQSITPKRYNDAKDLPLWGVETPKGMFSGNIHQLWGFLNSSYANVPNITSRRSPYLYPPFWPGTETPDGLYRSGSYLPASHGLTVAMSGLYSTSADYGTTDGYAGWNGLLDLGLSLRWQILSQDADSVAKLMRLVWTDIASNYFTGSRGWLNPSTLPQAFANKTESVTTNLVPVRQARRRIVYHWLYAIPALLLCLILLILVPITCFVAVTGALRDTSKYLSMLSAGRLLLHVAPEDDNAYRIPYKRWAKTPWLGMTTIVVQGWSWVRRQPDSGGEIELDESQQIPKHGHLSRPTVEDRKDANSNTAFLDSS